MNVTTDGFSFTAAFTTDAPAGFIIATATGGNTSEISAGVVFTGSTASAPTLFITQTGTNLTLLYEFFHHPCLAKAKREDGDAFGPAGPKASAR